MTQRRLELFPWGQIGPLFGPQAEPGLFTIDIHIVPMLHIAI